MPETCMYCGGEVRGIDRGEHVVPEALSCTKTIRCVCGACNNRLSAIDRALVSDSFLSLVVADELNPRQQRVWDYDDKRDIVLEAGMLQGYESPVLWPQIVFDDSGGGAS